MISERLFSARAYANRVVEAVLYPAFLSMPGRWFHRIWYKNRSSRVASGRLVRTAVVAHIYYVEMLPEIIACWRKVPGTPPLYITTVPEQFDVLKRELERTPGVTLHVTENRGRDVAPFMQLLQSGTLDNFDAVLKLHTKRSPHLKNGDVRRQMLLATIAGNGEVVTHVLNQFLDQKIGLIGWGGAFQTHEHYWMANRTRMLDLSRKMTPAATPEIAFFEGTMFWVRPAALVPLRSLELTQNDFEAEAGQLDGALHHALERLFCLSARAAGYETRSLSGRRLL